METVETPYGPLKVEGPLERFPDGTLRSCTPAGPTVFATPLGPLLARVGVSFRSDGSLRSLEPASPQRVPTPAGDVQAYDLDAVGISGDVNSLGFGPDGRVERVSTNLTQIAASGPRGQSRLFAPGLRESLCGDSESEPVPLRLEFGENEARVRTKADAPWTVLPLADWTLRSEPCLLQFAMPLGRLRCSG